MNRKKNKESKRPLTKEDIINHFFDNNENADTTQKLDPTRIIVDSTKSSEYGIKYFIKNDKEKIQPSLIEPVFIEGMAKVLTHGAKKYGQENWKNCQDRKRYKDALLRHILAYLKGEEKDQESGLSHLHHAACNLMFLEFLNQNN